MKKVTEYEKGKRTGLELAQFGVYGAIEANIFYYRLTESDIEKAKTKEAIKALCILRNHLAQKIKEYEN